MLGALGTLIRKDQRSLFSKHSDGLFVITPTLSHELEQEFVENLGERIRREMLDGWTREGFVLSGYNGNIDGSNGIGIGTDIGIGLGANNGDGNNNNNNNNNI